MNVQYLPSATAPCQHTCAHTHKHPLIRLTVDIFGKAQVVYLKYTCTIKTSPSLSQNYHAIKSIFN